MNNSVSNIMVQTWSDVVSESEIDILRKFLRQDDQWVDDRGDVRNKLMMPKDPDWPASTVRDILDRIMPVPYEIENADFVDMKIHSRLHADTADGDQRLLLKNVIIPLEIGEHASTAVFPHRWYGPKAKFTRVDLSPWQYMIADIGGVDREIKDIRDLFAVMQQTESHTVQYQDYWFTNNEIARSWISDLIHKRSTVDPRISDYSGIQGVHERSFPESFRQEWLAHLPSATLKGLDLPEIVQWRVGDAITFDRQYLHSGTSRISGYKSFLAVFTFHAL